MSFFPGSAAWRAGIKEEGQTPSTGMGLPVVPNQMPAQLGKVLQTERKSILL